MLPIVAALAHQVVHKAIAKQVAQHFASRVKSHPPTLSPAAIELERVEPSRAEEQRIPTREMFRRVQQSFTDGNRAFDRLLDTRAQNAALAPGELLELRDQASRLNEEVDQLSQAVEQSMAMLKAMR